MSNISERMSESSLGDLNLSLSEIFPYDENEAFLRIKERLEAGEFGSLNRVDSRSLLCSEDLLSEDLESLLQYEIAEQQKVDRANYLRPKPIENANWCACDEEQVHYTSNYKLKYMVCADCGKDIFVVYVHFNHGNPEGRPQYITIGGVLKYTIHADPKIEHLTKSEAHLRLEVIDKIIKRVRNLQESD